MVDEASQSILFSTLGLFFCPHDRGSRFLSNKICQTTLSHMSEDSDVLHHCCENVGSHIALTLVCVSKSDLECVQYAFLFNLGISALEILWWILEVKYVTAVDRGHQNWTLSHGFIHEQLVFTSLQEIVIFYIASRFITIITKSKSVPIFSTCFSCNPFQHYFRDSKLWNFRTKFCMNRLNLWMLCLVSNITVSGSNYMMNHEWQWKICTYSNVFNLATGCNVSLLHTVLLTTFMQLVSFTTKSGDTVKLLGILNHLEMCIYWHDLLSYLFIYRIWWNPHLMFLNVNFPI
jgi:hypothetical protein